MEIEFLTEYLKTIGYSSFDSARSTLSSIIEPVCSIWKFTIGIETSEGGF